MTVSTALIFVTGVSSCHHAMDAALHSSLTGTTATTIVRAHFCNNKKAQTLAKRIHTRKYGDAYGLRLTMNIKRDEYVGLLGDRAGIRYVVHDPHERPLLEQSARIAPTGVFRVTFI